MKLNKLIENITPVNICGDLDININEIGYDSRKLNADSLFICIDGFKDDGHQYIEQAIKRGAKAVLIEKELNSYDNNITYIRVKNSRKAMSEIADIFYKHPLDSLSLIGVTGTNGKTTTTYLIKSILEQAGYKTGLIGTIKNIIDDKNLPSVRTTPESLDLYRIFQKMVENDLKYAVMEVSSHALDLYRVYDMKFEIAVFTNISQDHLDYHQSITDYLEAKSLLFTQLKKDGTAVVNIDDPHSDKIIQVANSQILTYSIEKKSGFRAENISLTPSNVDFDIKEKGKINLNLTGRFNVYNALAAAGAGYSLGVDFKLIKRGLENVKGVAGRFELIDKGQEFAVVVDYAHTPDGMENVLRTARELVSENIIVVFGCGGDRDNSKRPIMGKIGVEYGDYCILTSDNPRSEDPLDILEQVEAGIDKGNDYAPYNVVPDRKEAIFQGIREADRGDMVIIFGKGHETYQIFRDKTIHFDDREEAQEALELLEKGELDEALKDLQNRAGSKW